MSDRETDDDGRPAGAVFPGAAGDAGRGGGADAGHAGVKGLGDPGGVKGLGDPGGVKGMGDPGGVKGLGDPGGVKGLGDPGGVKGLGDPGGVKGLGDPGGVKGLGGPGYGPPGAVPPPGYGPPGAVPPPGYAPPPGAGLSTRGLLVSVAAIVAAIVAVIVAIAAFLVLRPDPSRQTADEQSLGTTATPSDGATPSIVMASEPLFRGTYSSHVTVNSAAGTYTNDNVGTAVSDCPHCDVTLSGSGAATVFQWNGSVWEHVTEGPTCAGDSITFTPTVVADGFVQELTYYYATCNGTVSSGTMTRIGD